MKSSILIIDDEPQIRRLLRAVLEAQGYKIFEAETGAAGITQAATCLPDIIILDLALPDQPGIHVLKQLREWTQIPVLVLSVQDSEDDKVLALDQGADDYVTKPFNSQELLARLRVLLRRNQPIDEPVFETGKLRIDFAARVVRVNNNEVDLTATEYALLRILARNAGKVVTHKHLLNTVWGPNSVEQAQYLRVFMSHIRKKLAAAGLSPDLICTEPAIGYRLKFG